MTFFGKRVSTDVIKLRMLRGGDHLRLSSSVLNSGSNVLIRDTGGKGGTGTTEVKIVVIAHDPMPGASRSQQR